MNKSIHQIIQTEKKIGQVLQDQLEKLLKEVQAQVLDQVEVTTIDQNLQVLRKI